MPAQKILIVDDDELLLKSLSYKIAFSGFTTLQARNGKQGLQIALKKQPDLIILDVLMPIVDGITMLKKLRNNTWGNTVPVILLTNLEQSDKTLEEILKQHPIYYFTKHSLQIDELIRKIKNEL